MCLQAGQKKLEEKHSEQEIQEATRKHKQADDSAACQIVQRLENVDEEADEVPVRDAYDPTKFLEIPSVTEVKSCYQQFYNATSNAALVSSICSVCAQEVGVLDDSERMSKLHFNDIPNLCRLSPSTPHPAHNLYNGQLLEPAGVITQGNDTLVNICHSCLQDLKMPWQLQVLTFPEQLLIVLLYPQVFMFKLFPKKIGGVRDASTLQCGMCGNVSTYDMLQEGVVFEALQWLKKNNTKYYRDVEISSAWISELPENNVPQEIIEIVSQSTDIGVVDEESAGYVPNDEGDSEQPPAPRAESCSDGAGSKETDTTTEPRNEPLCSTEANSTEMEEPDVIPLQVSGAIDTDMSKLTATELMSWGLSNLWNEGKEGGDFPPDKKHSAEAEENHNFFEKAFPCLFPYGEGGIKAARLVKVDFGEHIRWALHYHDWQFRRHDTFPFMSFGILQQWQALGSAYLQMCHQTFDLDAKILSTITLEKLKSA
ncbi:uncharacterized protein BJ212DRAFT_1480806 [Suillus subaureus]|uniref:DUF6570 domain-containing protein n=1 Tax=Suillus subaureus TaxID=48587 RepID=A0A9P7EAV2_9AGAM|nr:uncharacterized protein BJ212DRAFT_1480806 [Suillus subaureus]KAG1816359.1 hypothetical protein BJ212DRAFT_1480806 [Suillus subaureus]